MIINEQKKQYVDECAEEYRKLLSSRVELLKMKGYTVDIDVTYSAEIETVEDDETCEPVPSDVFTEFTTDDNEKSEPEETEVIEDASFEYAGENAEVDDIFGFDDRDDDELMEECEKILGKRRVQKIKKESEAYPQKLDGSLTITIKETNDPEDDGMHFHLPIIPEEDVQLDQAIKYTEKERKKILKELDYILKHGLAKAYLKFTTNALMKEGFFLLRLFGFLWRWGKVILIVLLILLFIGAGLLTYFHWK